jgi:hypothetical protein
VRLLASARMRAVLYPAAILVAFVLNALVDSGMNPYSATRSLIVALLIGLVAAWLGRLATADRDRAGVLAMIMVLLILGGGSPGLVLLGLLALAMVGLQPISRAEPRLGP